MSIQKPQRESLTAKKQELSKRLTLNNVQEANLKSNIESIIKNPNDSFLQQIVDDALRMKQLEVGFSCCNSENFLTLCVIRRRLFKSARTKMLDSTKHSSCKLKRIPKPKHSFTR